MSDTPPEAGGSGRPVRWFRMTRGRRVGDAIVGLLVRAGLVPSTYLLTTGGRNTGRPGTNPVTIVEQDGRWWLVAPYGPVSWVHNARAAGRVSLRRRRDTRRYTIRELAPEEAGTGLQRYIRIAGATRPLLPGQQGCGGGGLRRRGAPPPGIRAHPRTSRIANRRPRTLTRREEQLAP